MLVHNPFYPALINAVRQTLENMVFMEVIEQPGPPGQFPANESAWTSLLIMDPVQGELRLAVSSQLLKKITAHVFGLEEDDVTSSQGYDILNELLNTIAGLFMTNLLAEDQQYQIGLPTLGSGELPESDDQTLTWHLQTVDDDLLKIQASGESLLALHHR